jgi:hypothetical protein
MKAIARASSSGNPGRIAAGMPIVTVAVAVAAAASENGYPERPPRASSPDSGQELLPLRWASPEMPARSEYRSLSAQPAWQIRILIP